MVKNYDKIQYQQSKSRSLIYGNKKSDIALTPITKLFPLALKIFIYRGGIYLVKLGYQVKKTEMWMGGKTHSSTGSFQPTSSYSLFT